MQQVTAERCMTSQAASRQWAKSEGSLKDRQSKAATMTMEMKKWCSLAAEAAEELEVPHKHVSLQSTILELAREVMASQLTETKALQEQSAAKSAKLLQLSAKCAKTTNELGCIQPKARP